MPNFGCVSESTRKHNPATIKAAFVLCLTQLVADVSFSINSGLPKPANARRLFRKDHI
jgi:F420-dependent methylenetetrahydromethanopterin dehydrogenase